MGNTSRKIHNELQEQTSVKKKWLVFGGLLILFLALALMCSYSKDAKGDEPDREAIALSLSAETKDAADAELANVRRAPTCTAAEVLDARAVRVRPDVHGHHGGPLVPVPAVLAACEGRT